MSNKEIEDINKNIHKFISTTQLYTNLINFAIKECIDFTVISSSPPISKAYLSSSYNSKNINNYPSLTEQEKECIKDKTNQFKELLIKNNIIAKSK